MQLLRPRVLLFARALQYFVKCGCSLYTCAIVICNKLLLTYYVVKNSKINTLMQHSVVCRLSVCLSVIPVYCDKKSEARLTRFSLKRRPIA